MGYTMSNMTLTFVGSDGAEFGTAPLRAAVSAAGNTYYAVLAKKKNGERYFSRYGVKIAAPAAELPSKVRITGTDGNTVTVSLVRDWTMGDTPRPRVKASTLHRIDGVDKNVRVSISVVQPAEGDTVGTWNLVASVTGAGKGSQAPVTLDDL